MNAYWHIIKRDLISVGVGTLGIIGVISVIGSIGCVVGFLLLLTPGAPYWADFNLLQKALLIWGGLVILISFLTALLFWIASVKERADKEKKLLK